MFPECVSCCIDPACVQHQSLLDTYCSQLSTCLQDCAFQAFPLVSKSSHIPGWNNGAHLLKDQANFWHKVWCQAGRPSSGVLHQIKKSAKSRYKYEVRRLKRREQFIRRQKLAEALANSNPKNFWQQVHRVNKSRKSSPVSTVDGSTGSQHIAQLFSSKFRTILTSCDTLGRDALHIHLYLPCCQLKNSTRSKCLRIVSSRLSLI